MITGTTTLVRCPYCNAIAFRREGNMGRILDKDGNVHKVAGVVATHCHNRKCGMDFDTDLTCRVS